MRIYFFLALLLLLTGCDHYVPSRNAPSFLGGLYFKQVSSFERIEAFTRPFDALPYVTTITRLSRSGELLFEYYNINTGKPTIISDTIPEILLQVDSIKYYFQKISIRSVTIFPANRHVFLTRYHAYDPVTYYSFDLYSKDKIHQTYEGYEILSDTSMQPQTNHWVVRIDSNCILRAEEI